MDSLLHVFDPYRTSRNGKFPSSDDPKLLEAISIASSLSQELKGLLQTSDRNLQELYRYSEACMSLTLPSPVRNLPNEIMGQIFQLYCGNWAYLEFPDPDDYRPVVMIAAVKLGQVCFRWRVITHSMTSLLSTIRIHFCDRATALTPKELSVVASTLKMFPHSNAVTISLTGGYCLEDAPGSVTHLSSTLSEFSPQISGIETDDLFYFLVQPACNFDALRSLTLGFLPSRSDYASFDLSDALPNLQVLHIQGNSPQLRLKWQFIKHLTLQECTPSYILSTVALCSELESLGLQSCWHLDVEGPIPPITTLRYVRSLTQGGSTSDVLDIVLGAILMPSLTKCSFDSTRFTFPKVSASLPTVIRSVTKLFLFCDGVSSLEDLQALLKTCVNLETIALQVNHSHDQDGSMSFPGELFWWPSAPSLRDVSLRFSNVQFDEASFVGMVASRWNSEKGRKIDSVSLNIRGVKHDFTDRGWKELRQMQQEGLRVHVDSHRGCVRTRFEERQRLDLDLGLSSGLLPLLGSGNHTGISRPL